MPNNLLLSILIASCNSMSFLLAKNPFHSFSKAMKWLKSDLKTLTNFQHGVATRARLFVSQLRQRLIKIFGRGTYCQQQSELKAIYLLGRRILRSGKLQERIVCRRGIYARYLSNNCICSGTMLENGKNDGKPHFSVTYFATPFTRMHFWNETLSKSFPVGRVSRCCLFGAHPCTREMKTHQNRFLHFNQKIQSFGQKLWTVELSLPPSDGFECVQRVAGLSHLSSGRLSLKQYKARNCRNHSTQCLHFRRSALGLPTKILD